MSDYGVWLSYNNQEEGFQFPVNPGSIEIGDGGKGSTYDISKLGEINVIKNPKLAQYSFSGIFPAQQYPLVTAPILPPVIVDGVKHNAYVYYIKKWMASKRPIRFILTAGQFEINTAASIESFSWKEVAGGGGDIEYSLTLKKYIFYRAQKVNIVPPPETATASVAITKEQPERPNEKQPPETYTMVSGDTLWKVAKSQLGNGDRWKEIQMLNGISDAELKKLPVGKVLKLPT